MIIDPTEPTSLKVPDLHNWFLLTFQLSFPVFLFLFFSGTLPYCLFHCVSFCCHYCGTGEELGPVAVSRKGADAVAADAGPSQLLGGGLPRTQASPWGRQAGQVVNSLHSDATLYEYWWADSSCRDKIYTMCVCVLTSANPCTFFDLILYLCNPNHSHTHTYTLWKKEALVQLIVNLWQLCALHTLRKVNGHFMVKFLTFLAVCDHKSQRLNISSLTSSVCFALKPFI